MSLKKIHDQQPTSFEFSKVNLEIANGILKKYGFISTGNFNESTAKVYTDLTLFTSNDKILDEVSNVFNFFNANYKRYIFKNLFVLNILNIIQS